MSFEESISIGYIKEVTPNINRSKNLHKASKEALNTVLEIAITTSSTKTVLRQLYESLRELCEAIGYKKGFKFDSHESILIFC